MAQTLAPYPSVLLEKCEAPNTFRNVNAKSVHNKVMRQRHNFIAAGVGCRGLAPLLGVRGGSSKALKHAEFGFCLELPKKAGFWICQGLLDPVQVSLGRSREGERDSVLGAEAFILLFIALMYLYQASR